MDRISEIEQKISMGELTSAQVFTQMRQLISSWISPSTKPLIPDGKYEAPVLIDSNYGVGSGFYASWSEKFHWDTGENEGLPIIGKVPFVVYGWQYLPAPGSSPKAIDNNCYIKLTHLKDGSVTGRGKSYL
jgi:hypothetical protein